MAKKKEKANEPLTIEESIKDLRKQVVHYNTMLLKAEGALEALIQINDSQDK
tara:strand:+ start:520 stop:675 length:156 start_codon:yes stop_codon:yes gene_type:complete